MPLRSAIVAVLMLSGASSAFAAPVDLSKPYGDERGCAYRLDQQYSEAFMMLLTATELTTTASLCTFDKTDTNPDGSLKLSASCAEEGEAGETPAMFTVKRGDKPDTLVILDEQGQVFGEVSLCK